ncbi:MULTISPECIES: TrbI/VirB10 family protein [Phyllobacteriaceae]|jgi:type IV secretion system protein TrbI|uniref:Conjugal transfer protein TraI n=1 Tax=Mesorhizobium hungaricum TaxID=1566387 RepID=A0A1C2E1A9_9HYPH|nr:MULTISPECIES: TrbI/VirB10 family protein [Mesorhizobium]MBN9235586.1 TrbI/VirB10 family protein [Mesorhizobium sp.]MDQ0331258.1 type IV secretion system protein VirB10 [Mesorhizobium sp. YL-MeA3-2017]OCX20715.1 conjugal transfer protein TraI [Mesorhizobium hungaricum]
MSEKKEAGAASAMRLRAEPPRVTRLSRKALASVALVASLGLGGALIYALRTPMSGDAGEELYSTTNRQPADGLAGLPRDYTGPVLGPPLPGDLGRPILEAQNKGQPATPPVITAPAVDEAEQRRRQDEEAARTSRIFFQASPGVATAGPAGALPPSLGGPDPAGLRGQQTIQDRQLAFLDAPVDRRTTSADRVTQPASPFVLQAGAVIPAALITGIRSDLPGQITAQVTENVYDSLTGRSLLVPQGARMVGQYDNGTQFGQRRILLVWNRLIFPNGRSVVLERQPGADAQGYAGLQDGVDHHWWDLAKAAGLSTLLAVGTELAVSEDGRLVAAIRRGMQETINDAGQQIVRSQLQVPPTLTIRPGFPVRVVVTRDLVLEPYTE